MVIFKTVAEREALRSKLERWLGQRFPKLYARIACYTVTVNPEKFIDLLFKQKHSIISQLGEYPDTLLIGANDYREIMRESVRLRSVIEFDCAYNRDSKIIGLHVVVVPYISGAVVVNGRWFRK